MKLEYFNLSEFDCTHTGENRMDPAFLKKLDYLRKVSGFTFVVTSGYRSPQHPIEANKDVPGRHSQGIAADIRITDAAQRYTIIKNALALGFTGVGVAGDFVHVDTRDADAVMWVY
jgi:uncharacterized protein YcbK (DUF882 family)